MFNIGDMIWVMDKNKPYQCKIVDKRGTKLEVHFKNFNTRHDIWIEEDSPRIVEGPPPVVGRVSGEKSKRGGSDDEVSGDMEPELNPRKRKSFSIDGSIEKEQEPNLDEVVDQRSAAASSDLLLPPLNGPVAQVSSISPLPGVMRAVQKCALCCVVMSGRSVSCGGCGSSFHAEPLCLGVNENVVQVLLEGGDAISYKCCKY